jgi:zinc-binding alcohol dehydrogenase family protein
MKAIAYRKPLPISEAESLIDIELPDPTPGDHDLLVEVHAVSVNPVDTKVRKNVAPADGENKVLGWDVAGIVKAVGPKATLFKAGDRVWYAGSLIRPGANSELHVVDERIVGHMPTSTDFVNAASLPLTTITAYEMLFDRLAIGEGDASHGKTLMVIGAAGGVGSILVQLARQLTGLTIVGTASRAETRSWLEELGAHHVIDHSKPLSEELKRIGIDHVDYIVSLNQTDSHWPQIVESIAPQGKIALIDDPDAIDVRMLKRKSASLHWEFMYTRSMFGTPDMIKQHELLDRVASLIDAGKIRTTVSENFGTINAANLKRAHALIESHKAKGKIVLEGF